jgi:protein phosphatase
MERSNNQDYLGFWEPEDDDGFARLGRLAIVCDGMGGHAGGEVASQLAVHTIIDAYSDHGGDEPGAALKRAIEAANRAVWDKAQRDPGLHGMGTTVVAMALKEGTAYIAHVGDSRCYRVRDGRLDAMTLDHSLVQRLVSDGVIREEDMEQHQDKNVILRSLGVKPDVEVELHAHAYEVDDVYIIASDGVTGLVSKQEVLDVVLHFHDHPHHAAAYLIDLANRYGGYDNVTAQVVRVRAMSPDEARRLPPIPQLDLYPQPAAGWETAQMQGSSA